MTASVGTIVSTDQRTDTLSQHPVWEKIVTFAIISGDTTGAATVAINGILQKIIVTISDFTTGDGTVDVILTDGGDNVIFTVSNLSDPAAVTAPHMYSVSEPLAGEVNVALTFTDPTAAETVTVTLRGV